MFIREGEDVNVNVLEPLEETYLDRWANEIRGYLEKPRAEMRELILKISDYQDRIEFLKEYPEEFNNLKRKFTKELQKYEIELTELEEKCKPKEKLLEIIEKAIDEFRS